MELLLILIFAGLVWGWRVMDGGARGSGGTVVMPRPRMPRPAIPPKPQAEGKGGA